MIKNILTSFISSVEENWVTVPAIIFLIPKDPIGNLWYEDNKKFVNTSILNSLNRRKKTYKAAIKKTRTYLSTSSFQCFFTKSHARKWPTGFLATMYISEGKFCVFITVPFNPSSNNLQGKHTKGIAWF